MNAYSEDLRNKFVGALRPGMTKSEAARTSSVKNYAKLVEEGRPLAPKKRPGSKLKMFMAISSPLYIVVRASQSRCVWVGG